MENAFSLSLFFYKGQKRFVSKTSYHFAQNHRTLCYELTVKFLLVLKMFVE